LGTMVSWGRLGGIVGTPHQWTAVANPLLHPQCSQQTSGPLWADCKGLFFVVFLRGGRRKEREVG